MGARDAPKSHSVTCSIVGDAEQSAPFRILAQVLGRIAAARAFAEVNRDETEGHDDEGAGGDLRARPKTRPTSASGSLTPIMAWK
jgi:hypothetical protein